MSGKTVILSPSLNKEFGEFISQGKDLTDVLEWIKEKVEYGYLDVEQILSLFTLDDWANRKGYSQ